MDFFFTISCGCGCTLQERFVLARRQNQHATRALPRTQIGGLETTAPWLLCAMPTNVLGTELRCCCRDPMTGFYRDGYCRTGPDDIGLHTVCVEVTEEFLDFSVLDGNDLVTPMPEWGFPGLKPGDRWCVCVTRWKAALERGRAAPIDLEATHSSVLEFVDLEDLKAHAVKA
jgi:uncharacterized protein (DUF2237 family)